MPFAKRKQQCARCCDEHLCFDCNKLFPNACAFISHLKQNARHRRCEEYGCSFRCTICKSNFASKCDFIDHLEEKLIHKYDLHQAACCGRYQDVAQLIHSEYANEAGASHQTKASGELAYQVGDTPMHCAAFKGYSKCLRIMLSWDDGDPNIKDSLDGQTPVHLAARCGKASTLKLLLNRGGRLDIEDVCGYTPISYARGSCIDIILTYQVKKAILSLLTARISVNKSSSEVSDKDETARSNASNSRSSVRRCLSLEATVSREILDERCEDDSTAAGVYDTVLRHSNESVVVNKECYGTDQLLSEQSVSEDHDIEVSHSNNLGEENIECCGNNANQISMNQNISEGKEIIECFGNNANQISMIQNISKDIEVPHSNEDNKEYGSNDANQVEDIQVLESNDSIELINKGHCYNENQLSTRQDVSEPQSPSDIKEVPSELLPYEILARGEKAVESFKTALSKGTASAHRLRLSVIGEVGAGKTSLTRSISGQPFIEDRIKTHGIETSMVMEPMVDNTELNVSWNVADPKDCHFDELVAAVVSKSLSELPPNTEQPDLDCSTSPKQETQIMQPQTELPGLVSLGQVSSTRTAAHPHISVEGTPRKLPATRIAEKLLRKSFEPSSVKVSIWDFAGHQLYETMHHLFMNNSCVYLVVFSLLKMKEDMEKSLARIHYWLNSVASHTSAATPVIIVGTHRDQVKPEFIQTVNDDCEKHFGKTFGPRLVKTSDDKIMIAVENSLDQRGPSAISDLIDMIKREASSTLPFVTESFPLKWLQCEEEIVAYQLLSDSKKIMNVEEVRKMLEDKCNITFTDEEFHSMLMFFHDNGLILVPGKMTGVEIKPSVRDLVVLSPQYLVDVMTRIHDVRKTKSLKRQYSDEFHKLRSEGRADSRLLEDVWRDCEKNDILVDLLDHFNLLYPLDTNLDDESNKPQNISTEFIIPCMVKERSSKYFEKKWKKVCEEWKNLSAEENILVFDFGRFLPPPLFDYLLVSMCRCCSKSGGMKPYLTKTAAYFSFSNKYLFRIQLELKNSQIWIHVRNKNGELFIHLAKKLFEQVKQICQQYFKFLKFIFGPPCPRQECPGAEFHVDCIQRPCESSSSGSENSSNEEDATETPEGQPFSDETSRRRHILQMKPSSFDPPYWCGTVEINPDDLEEWRAIDATDQDLCKSFEEGLLSDSPEAPVDECCINVVAGGLAKGWQNVGRKLNITEAEILNIDSDQDSQEEKGHQILHSWKKINGSEATWKKLGEVLKESKRKDLCEILETHVKEYHP